MSRNKAISGDATIAIRMGRWREAPRVALRPVFAVGDVHGRDDLLVSLIDAIKAIISDDRLQDCTLVFLGDYVDRGPCGIAALKRVLDLHSNRDWSCVCLPGNHEQLLRAFLTSSGSDRKRVFRIWARNGGREVVRELGLDAEDASSDLDLIAELIALSLGRDRLEKLATLPNHYRLGDYIFVHAGIHPAVGLSSLGRDWTQLPVGPNEEETDPLWVRGPFLTHEADHEQGVVVVHGHTPRREIEFLANRIGLDTGAYQTGRLSAVQLIESKARVIQAVYKPQKLRWLSQLMWN